MDRYLGMGFSYNPDTGAMTASMKHSVIKILETFLTSDLPVQSTHTRWTCSMHLPTSLPLTNRPTCDSSAWPSGS
jgi:hypothetical protein